MNDITITRRMADLILAAALFSAVAKADAKDVRYSRVANRIRIERTGRHVRVIATDGHAIFVGYATAESDDVSAYVTLPIDELVATIKQARKSVDDTDAVAVGSITVNDDATADVLITDKTGAEVLSRIPLCTESYPDWRRVIPQPEMLKGEGSRLPMTPSPSFAASDSPQRKTLTTQAASSRTSCPPTDRPPTKYRSRLRAAFSFLGFPPMALKLLMR